MKIQLLSDLHLEFYASKDAKNFIDSLIAPADTLVLAGDIDVGRTNTAASINAFASNYKHVVYVPGNHEYYGGTVKSWELFQEKLNSNVFFLNPGTCFLPDGDEFVAFIGGTLWTNFDNDPEAEQIARAFIQDFRRIGDLNTNECRLLHQEHADAFRHGTLHAEGHNCKVVYVSHFLPIRECVHPRWRTVQGVGSKLNSYFCNDMNIEFAADNSTWLFGHTHDTMDFVGPKGIRFIANPAGYPNSFVRENGNFDPHLIIEV